MIKFNTKEGIDFIRDRKNVIDQQITKRIDQLPPGIKMITKRCILTGGSIASIFNIETPNDYDLLFLFNRDLDQFKSPVILESLKSMIKSWDDYGTSPSGSGKAITDWAVSMKNDLQFILKTVDHRLRFDFIHCMPYYDITRKKLFISHAQYDAIMNKELIVNPGCPDGMPIETRMSKYTSRGWVYKEPLTVDQVKAQVEVMKLLQKQNFIKGMAIK